MKKNSLSTTKLIATGSLGVVLLILQLNTALINIVAPSTVFSGPLGSIIYTAMTVICLLTIKQFLSATIMFTVYGILAIPFFLLGTPGFVLKVPIAFFAGLLCDLTYFLLKNKSEKLISVVVGGPLMYYIGVVIIESAKLFNIPGMSTISKVIYSPGVIVGTMIIGAIGGYIGFLIYIKLKNTALMKRIQNA